MAAIKISMANGVANGYGGSSIISAMAAWHQSAYISGVS